MILHLLRMRRNVNRIVFNDRKHVSATLSPAVSSVLMRDPRLPVGSEPWAAGLNIGQVIIIRLHS